MLVAVVASQPISESLADARHETGKLMTDNDGLMTDLCALNPADRLLHPAHNCCQRGRVVGEPNPPQRAAALGTPVMELAKGFEPPTG